MTDKQAIWWHQRYTKDQVKALQKALNDSTPDQEKKIKVDGVVGVKTINAIKRFQSENPELEVDGLAGDKTLAALGVLDSDTFNDPQLPLTMKGVDQKRRTNIKTDPEKSKKVLEKVKTNGYKPITLTNGGEGDVPLKILPYGEMAQDLIDAGPYARAIINRFYLDGDDPERIYSKTVTQALMPRTFENPNVPTAEDKRVIKQQLLLLSKINPELAEAYQNFLEADLEDVVQAVYLQGKTYYPPSPEHYSDATQAAIYELLNELPSLSGFISSDEQDKEVDKYIKKRDGHTLFRPDGSLYLRRQSPTVRDRLSTMSILNY